MQCARVGLVAATIMFATSTVASAQVNFETQGRFTGPVAGCTSPTFATSATCAGPGFNIFFEGTTGTNIGSGSVASLGSFRLGDTADITLAPGEYTFELFINQLTPTAGTGAFSGSVFGTLITGANGTISTVEWDPNQSITIAGVNYLVIFDNLGPAANRGLGMPINNMRGINAQLTVESVVPEPSALLLSAGGLLALMLTVRRRQYR